MVFVFIGQDAWEHFIDDKRLDERRYEDLSQKFSQISGRKSILVTHHAPSEIFDRMSVI